MSVEELEALARKHWTEWLPEKVAELEADGRFREEVHAAALLAQREIDQLMSRGYSIDEAMEVALPLFILLPPEDPLGDMSPELREELAQMEREYRRNPPPEVRMYEFSEEDMEGFDRTIQRRPHLPHNRQAALPTPTEEDDITIRELTKGLKNAAAERAALNPDEDEISERGIERGLNKALKRRQATLPTPSEEDEISGREILKGLREGLGQRKQASLDMDED